MCGIMSDGWGMTNGGHGLGGSCCSKIAIVRHIHCNDLQC